MFTQISFYTTDLLSVYIFSTYTFKPEQQASLSLPGSPFCNHPPSSTPHTPLVGIGGTNSHHSNNTNSLNNHNSPHNLHHQPHHHHHHHPHHHHHQHHHSSPTNPPHDAASPTISYAAAAAAGPGGGYTASGGPTTPVAHPSLYRSSSSRRSSKLSWRSNCGPGTRKPLPLSDVALSAYFGLSLPYADDSDVATTPEPPFSEDEGGSSRGETSGGRVRWSHYSNNSINKSYVQLAAAAAAAASSRGWQTTTGAAGGGGGLSRKNSYCSHGSRWSYSSHADPLLLYRSASRSVCYDRVSLAGGGGGGGGTAAQQSPSMLYLPNNNTHNNNHNNPALAISDEFMNASIPPDYLVSIYSKLTMRFCLT